ncbi:MAG: 2-aminobenzoate-CoA ligase [Alphaproteobacteria bacterium]|nr:MAG: 2-aminobenzoate-CoA ligase [Alphaproteobacteria bacterium]
MVQSAHVDTFARDNLPPRDQWPELRFDLPELQYPERLNAADVLIEGARRAGLGSKTAVIAADYRWTYDALAAAVNRIAHVLVDDLGIVPGNRVLIRGPNNAMYMAIWLAVLKAGAVAVATMPLLRAPELRKYIAKARVGVALCDHRLRDELDKAQADCPDLKRIVSYGNGELERLMEGKPEDFAAVDTAAEDVALLGFTSGTTGQPKATMHFHRDVLAMSDTAARYVIKPEPDEVFTGSPPFAFTFGLGALLVFPMRFHCTTVLLEQPSPEAILDAIEAGATTLFTAPTMYRVLMSKFAGRDISNLRKCVSAGEHLPKATWEDWYRQTGIRIIDGLGATEMIHIFISAAGDDIRPGATGKAVPGYEACVLDENYQPLPPGSTGYLAVRGPTGCRYLADERQKHYVVNGWNVTGDTYRMDEDGYFWFVARADDMIISSGYNIAGPEVEEALLRHSAVQECAVVGAPDPERGQVVKAFVVLKPGVNPGEALAKELQDFVKAEIAPYKYPRAIEFVDALPKTPTGKIQRFKLKEREKEHAATAS